MKIINLLLMVGMALMVGYWWGYKSAAPQKLTPAEIAKETNRGFSPLPSATTAANTPENKPGVRAAASAGCPTYAPAANPLLPAIEGLEVIDIANADLEKLKGEWEGMSDDSDAARVKISLKIGQEGSARNLKYDIAGDLSNSSGTNNESIGSEKGTGHSIIKISDTIYLKVYGKNEENLSGLLYSKFPDTKEFESVGWLNFYRR